MRIGQSHIDLEALEITGPTGTSSVEPMVMEVLSILVDNAGHVVTRDDLIDKVWGVGYGGDERLSRAISLLRKALGDTPGKHEYIQTIPKRGYKLTTDIEWPNQIGESAVLKDPSQEHQKQVKKRTGKLIPLALAAFVALVALVFVAKDYIMPPPEPPLVVIMDSAHPSRIYDEDVKSDGGTNADILSDILADLPVQTQKELISPSWHRYEAMLQFNPDLIVIHYSGFKQEDASGDRPQLRQLVEYFENTETEFLIYSRANQSWLQGNMDIILEELYARNPQMRDRIDIFPLLEYGEANWMDLGTSQGIKVKIKDMLALE